MKDSIEKKIIDRSDEVISNCEICGRILTGEDFESYWEGSFPNSRDGEIPSHCLDCAKKDGLPWTK